MIGKITCNIEEAKTLSKPKFAEYHCCTDCAYESPKGMRSLFMFMNSMQSVESSMMHACSNNMSINVNDNKWNNMECTIFWRSYFVVFFRLVTFPQSIINEIQIHQLKSKVHVFFWACSWIAIIFGTIYEINC